MENRIWPSRNDTHSQQAFVHEDATPSPLPNRQPRGRSYFTHFYDQHGPDEIRVVVLAPGGWDEPFSFTFQYATLDSFACEALSYCWGSPEQPHETVVPQGQELEITTLLHSALRHLRKHNMPRIVWIDRLCVNRHNDLEKETQVSIMRDICSKPEHLVTWLGQESDESYLAMHTIRTMCVDSVQLGPPFRLNRTSLLQAE